VFFPWSRPFLVPVALPGDDVRPEDLYVSYGRRASRFITFMPTYGTKGFFAISGKQRFLDRQGAVHARVSVDFVKEFQCLLEIPLKHMVEY